MNSHNSMLPTKRMLKYIGLVTTILITLVSIVIGWTMHLSLWNLLMLALIVVICCSVGLSIGWLFWMPVLRQAQKVGKKLVMDTSLQNNPVEKLHVEYEQNIDDVLAYNFHYLEQSPQLGHARKQMRHIVPVTIAFSLLIAIILEVLFGKQLLPFVVAIGVIMVLTFLWSVVSPLLMRKVVRRTVSRKYARGRNKLIGNHRLSISSDSVIDITDMGKSTIRWSDVTYVASNAQYLFVSVRASEPYIVPRRAFASEEAFKQFVEAVKAYPLAAIRQT